VNYTRPVFLSRGWWLTPWSHARILADRVVALNAALDRMTVRAEAAEEAALKVTRVRRARSP